MGFVGGKRRQAMKMLLGPYFTFDWTVFELDGTLYMYHDQTTMYL